MTDGSISVFFPCFNDEVSIGPLVRTVHELLVRRGREFEVIVVDDGSSDGSAAVLRELAAWSPRVRVVTHEVNRGYGGALRSGFDTARNDWVFYTDGDGQYDPLELDRFLPLASDTVDVVQGYKLGRGDGFGRWLIGWTYGHAVSWLFGLRIRDPDCDFRLIRRSVLDRVQLEASSGAITVELVRKLQDAGARFVEVPVHHYRRHAGRSQFFKPRSIARTLRDLLQLRRRLGPPRGPINPVSRG